MTVRLTDEQVAEALRQARAADVTEGICYAGFVRESDACLCNEHSRRRIARALLQVSADLSVAKEELRQYKGVALLEAEAKLSTLQSAARDVLAARSCCDPACCRASVEHTKALEALAEALR